jgi:hypothetical protein
MINHPRFHHVYRWYKPPFPVMCGLPPCFNHINIIIYVVSTVVTIILLFSYYYAASVFSSDYDWNCDRDFFVTKDEPGHRWNPWLSHVYWLNFRYVPSKTVHIKLYDVIESWLNEPLFEQKRMHGYVSKSLWNPLVFTQKIWQKYVGFMDVHPNKKHGQLEVLSFNPFPGICSKFPSDQASKRCRNPSFEFVSCKIGAMRFTRCMPPMMASWGLGCDF